MEIKLSLFQVFIKKKCMARKNIFIKMWCPWPVSLDYQVAKKKKKQNKTIRQQQQVFLQPESPGGWVQQPWQEAGVFQRPRNTHRVRKGLGDAHFAPHGRAGLDRQAETHNN